MTAEAAGEPTLEVVLVPRTTRFDPDDDRWHAQVRTFYAGLREEVGEVHSRATPVSGTKGAVSDVILALGSAGAFTASVEYFRAWLGRDKSRSLEISLVVDGKEEKVTVQGESIDPSTLHIIAAAAAQRVGGAPWPIPTTEPC